MSTSGIDPKRFRIFWSTDSSNPKVQEFKDKLDAEQARCDFLGLHFDPFVMIGYNPDMQAEVDDIIESLTERYEGMGYMVSVQEVGS